MQLPGCAIRKDAGFAGGKEARAGSREQGTGNWELGTEAVIA